jgi:hypothetical protein
MTDSAQAGRAPLKSSSSTTYYRGKGFTDDLLLAAAQNDGTVLVTIDDLYRPTNP